MNYKVYYNGVGKNLTFNYLEKVGDLQSILLESYRIKKENLLYILWDTKILGIDISFRDSLISKNLFNVTLFIVIDSDNQAVGSKDKYIKWLEEVSDPNQIIDSHRQIMYHNILNNTWSSTAINFMSVSNGENNNSGQETRRSRNVSTRPRSYTRSTSSLRPTVSTRTNIGNSYGTNFGNQSNHTLSSMGNITNQSTNRPSVYTNRSPSSSNMRSSLNETATSNPSYSSTIPSGSLRRATQGNRPDRSPPSRNNINNQVQDLMSIFLNPTNSTNGQTSLFDTIMNMGIGEDGSHMDITFSTASYNVPGGENFWNYLNGLESVPVTLSREMLDTLPTFLVSELPSDIKNDESNNPHCTICLQEYQDTDQVRVLLCKHYFHKNCIDTWLSEQNVRCPLCRHDSRQPSQSNEDDEMLSAGSSPG